MSIKQLPPEVLEKARSEINEVPERIQEDLQHIKDWLKKQPHLKARTDDQWLLAFLRGCKYSLERTKEKLDFFYTVRSMIPEFFKDRDPMKPELQAALKTGTCIPLINKKDPLAPGVILIRGGAYDPSVTSQTDVFKTNMMLMDLGMLEDHAGIINGIHVVQDMGGMNIGHMMSPALAKKAMTVFQQTYPNRPKGIHMFNLPSFFEMMFSMFKPFLTEKMKNRMNIYTGDHHELFEKIPKYMLPNEYGGEAGPIDELIDQTLKKVEEYRDWFIEDEQYGCNEKLRPGRPKTSDELFGIEGSFRKLNVD